MLAIKANACDTYSAESHRELAFWARIARPMSSSEEDKEVSPLIKEEHGVSETESEKPKGQRWPKLLRGVGTAVCIIMIIASCALIQEQIVAELCSLSACRDNNDQAAAGC